MLYQLKADLDSADLDYQTLMVSISCHIIASCVLLNKCIRQLLSFKAKLEATAEEGIITKRSLNRVSSELEVKKEELKSAEENLRITQHFLKAKEEECYASEVGVVWSEEKERIFKKLVALLVPCSMLSWTCFHVLKNCRYWIARCIIKRVTNIYQAIHSLL